MCRYSFGEGIVSSYVVDLACLIQAAGCHPDDDQPRGWFRRSVIEDEPRDVVKSGYRCDDSHELGELGFHWSAPMVCLIQAAGHHPGDDQPEGWFRLAVGVEEASALVSPEGCRPAHLVGDEVLVATVGLGGSRPVGVPHPFEVPHGDVASDVAAGHDQVDRSQTVDVASDPELADPDHRTAIGMLAGGGG